MTVPNTYKHGYPPNKYAEVVFAGKYQRDPSTSDLYSPTVGGYWPLGTVWINENLGTAFILTDIVSGNSAQWTEIAAAPVEGGTAATKGTFTLVGGTVTIPTTAVLATSVICVNPHVLGTVTVPSAFYTPITPGTSFAITASQALIRHLEHGRSLTNG